MLCHAVIMGMIAHNTAKVRTRIHKSRNMVMEVTARSPDLNVDMFVVHGESILENVTNVHVQVSDGKNIVVGDIIVTGSIFDEAATDVEQSWGELGI
jgi:hypothetical protein